MWNKWPRIDTSGAKRRTISKEEYFTPLFDSKMAVVVRFVHDDDAKVRALHDLK